MPRQGLRPLSRPLYLGIAFVTALTTGSPLSAQNADRLGSELSGIEAQIADADAVIALFWWPCSGFGPG